MKRLLLFAAVGNCWAQAIACESPAAHGFFGKDAAVAKAIKDWMFGREFPREIN